MLLSIFPSAHDFGIAGFASRLITQLSPDLALRIKLRNGLRFKTVSTPLHVATQTRNISATESPRSEVKTMNEISHAPQSVAVFVISPPRFLFLL